MSAESAKRWSTAITQIEPNHVRVRGYDIAELMGRVSFGAAIHLILRGELPTPAVGRLVEAMLVASIDHGATPPSALAARTVASTGATLSAAAAAGILSINQHHGGAIENCARQLTQIVKRCRESGQSFASVAAAAIDEMKVSGQRMSGFGHRIHTADPRSARLFDLAREAEINGPFMEAALAIEALFRSSGRGLPLNVDGAIAAVLGDLGYPFELMNGLFMIARTPGLIAHALEEQTRARPMRPIDPVAHDYDGPPARSMIDG